MRNELLPNNANSPATDFSNFELFLEQFGLPTEGIIAPPTERRRILSALPEFLESLSPEVKKDARYLSKFVAGSAVGLFDASLNFVWNEVVLHLRRKIVVYGLDIFFDSAIGGDRREHYKSEEDLQGLKDRTLLDTCRKLELISDIVHKKLSHILTMRNDVGASHPNGYSINSYELLGWLQTCITDVLADEPSKAAITVKSIVDNVKRQGGKLSEEIVNTFENSIKELSTQMAANLLMSMFSIFVSAKTENATRENVLRLIPIIWQYTTDEVKYDLGEKVDVYSANLDTEKVRLAETFFEKCNGNRYYSLGTRVIKLSNLCDQLLNANQGWDNFYHEPPFAKKIMSFLRTSSDIPKERERKIIKTFLICRIGREVSFNKGVSPGAKPYYDDFFAILDEEQIKLAVKTLEQPEIRHNLAGTIRSRNAIEILQILNTSLLADRLIEILDFLIENEEHLENAFVQKQYGDLTKGILV